MTKRIERVNKLLKQEVAKALLREIGLPDDILVTVTRAETTPNLVEARIYISVLPIEKTENVLTILKKTVWKIQQILNKKLDMRPMPKIIIAEEKGIKEADKIEKLLEEIKGK